MQSSTRLLASALLALAACSTDQLGTGASDPTATVGANGEKLSPVDPSLTGKTDGLLGPPYPLIFVHGMGGFKNIGPVNYFHGVESTLHAQGFDVYFSVTDPLNTSEVRGAQLLAFVASVRDRTRKRKVHLIGHSQGGFDVRWVAGARPEWIDSVTSIATPHQGTAVADLVEGLVPGPAQDVLSAIASLYGAAMGFDQSNLKAQLESMATAGARAFNAAHPDQPSVRYYSIAGRSNLSPGGPECMADLQPAPSFIARYAGVLDPMDPILAVPAGVLNQHGDSNDGLVAVTSARWGRFLGCIPADHMDEVCQLLGDSPGSGNSFDCQGFYLNLAGWLQHQTR